MLKPRLAFLVKGPVVSFYQFLGHPLILKEGHLCKYNQRRRLSCSYYEYRGKISPVPLQRNKCGSCAPT